MFKINPNPTFTLSVRLTVAGDPAGQLLELSCRHKSRPALKAWVEGASVEQADAVFLGEVVEGWSGVVDADGQALPFTPENFAALLDNYPPAGIEIYTAYQKELSESRAKN